MFAVVDLLRKTYQLLDHRTRRALVVSVAISIVLGLVEVLAIGLVLPFLQVVADPAVVDTMPLFERLFELVGAEDSREFGTTLGIVIIGLFSLRGLASLVFTWWQTGVLAFAEARMSGDLMTGYLRAPYEMHLRRNSSELIRNVHSSTTSIFYNVVFSMLSLLTDGVVMVFIAVVLIVAEPVIALVTVVFFGIIGAIYYLVLSRTALRMGEYNERFGADVYRMLQQGLDGVKEIRARGSDEHFGGAFRWSRNRWADTKRKQAFLAQLPRYFLETVLIVSVVALSVLLLRRRAPAETIAVLGLFGAAGFRLMPAVNRVLSAIQALKIGSAAADSLFADREHIELGRVMRAATAERLSFSRVIEVRDLRFRYAADGPDVLDGIDLEIRHGESVAVVGPSGSGKTTFIDVLLGLLPPTEGSVHVDGVDIDSAPEAWSRIVAYVPQAVYLLDDSVRRNVAFGIPDREIDEERVVEAVRLAQLDELVVRLPSGLDTEVGERGTRLSGGERQRIGIARALYVRPEVLVLDEATSALDSETESRIAATINALRDRMTMVIVAHRLSTVRSCDRLFLLERGRVAASGTFDELQRTSDVFAELVRLGQLAASEA